MNSGIRKLSSDRKEQALAENGTFWGQGIERKLHQNEPKCKTMEKKDNIFRRFIGSSHTALLSYHSHRGYLRASKSRNSTLFLRFSHRFFQFSLLVHSKVLQVPIVQLYLLTKCIQES